MILTLQDVFSGPTKEDFDRFGAKKCVRFFARALLLWPCHHSALARLACGLHLQVGGGPDPKAQSRSKSEMERQFRCAKIKRSKPFSKHHATNAPVCNSIYTHIYIYHVVIHVISCDHFIVCMSMHPASPLARQGRKQCWAVLGVVMFAVL